MKLTKIIWWRPRAKYERAGSRNHHSQHEKNTKREKPKENNQQSVSQIKARVSQVKINIRTQISPMHRISLSPNKKLLTPRKPMRPRKSPFKSPRNPGLSRIIIPHVGGEIEEEANPGNRSTTGSLGLNENPGTPIWLNYPDVTAPPDTSTSPLKKKSFNKIRTKWIIQPPETASAIGYGNPSKDAFSTANQGKNSQQRQQNDHRSVYGTPFMIRSPRICLLYTSDAADE